MTDPSDFERGHHIGGQDAQLAQHERRLDVVNGSIIDSKKAIEVLTLAVQQLVDKFEASAQAAIMLAAALKDADEARRNMAVQAAQPTQRRQALILVVASVVGMIVGLVGMYFVVRGR